MLLLDRLIEARSEALNGHVFTAVCSERLTNLHREPDLLPLARRERSCMVDGILSTGQGLGGLGASPPATTRSSADLVHGAPAAFGHLPPPYRMSAMRVSGASLKSAEEAAACSPRIGTAVTRGAGELSPSAAGDHVRRLYFGRDKGPSRVSGFW
jgi:hypothetical protein